MSTKYNINDVINYIKNISNNECSLISTEYKNGTTPLEIRCRCGKHFYKDFEHIKRKRTTKLQCEDCLKKRTFGAL